MKLTHNLTHLEITRIIELTWQTRSINENSKQEKQIILLFVFCFEGMNSTIHYESTAVIFLFAGALFFILLSSAFLNVFAIFVFARNPVLGTPNNTLIVCHLTASLLRSAVTCIGEGTTAIRYPHDTDCTLSAFVSEALGQYCIGMVFVIGLQRYDCVVHPHKQTLSTQPALIISQVVLFVYSLLVSLPSVFWGSLSLDHNIGICSATSSANDSAFILYLCILGYIVPSLALSVTYFKLFLTIQAHKKSNQTVLQQSSFKQVEKRSKQLITAILVSYFVLYSPYFTCILLAGSLKYDVHPIVLATARIMSISVTISDPVVYAVMNQLFRICMIRTLQRKLPLRTRRDLSSLAAEARGDGQKSSRSITTCLKDRDFQRSLMTLHAIIWQRKPTILCHRSVSNTPTYLTHIEPDPMENNAKQNQTVVIGLGGTLDVQLPRISIHEDARLHTNGQSSSDGISDENGPSQAEGPPSTTDDVAISIEPMTIWDIAMGIPKVNPGVKKAATMFKKFGKRRSNLSQRAVVVPENDDSLGQDAPVRVTISDAAVADTSEVRLRNSDVTAAGETSETSVGAAPEKTSVDAASPEKKHSESQEMAELRGLRRKNSFLQLGYKLMALSALGQRRGGHITPSTSLDEAESEEDRMAAHVNMGYQ